MRKYCHIILCSGSSRHTIEIVIQHLEYLWVVKVWRITTSNGQEQSIIIVTSYLHLNYRLASPQNIAMHTYRNASIHSILDITFLVSDIVFSHILTYKCSCNKHIEGIASSYV